MAAPAPVAAAAAAAAEVDAPSSAEAAPSAGAAAATDEPAEAAAADKPGPAPAPQEPEPEPTPETRPELADEWEIEKEVPEPPKKELKPEKEPAKEPEEEEEEEKVLDKEPEKEPEPQSRALLVKPLELEGEATTARHLDFDAEQPMEASATQGENVKQPAAPPAGADAHSTAGSSSRLKELEPSENAARPPPAMPPRPPAEAPQPPKSAPQQSTGMPHINPESPWNAFRDGDGDFYYGKADGQTSWELPAEGVASYPEGDDAADEPAGAVAESGPALDASAGIPQSADAPPQHLVPPEGMVQLQAQLSELSFELSKQMATHLQGAQASIVEAVGAKVEASAPAPGASEKSIVQTRDALDSKLTAVADGLKQDLQPFAETPRKMTELSAQVEAIEQRVLSANKSQAAETTAAIKESLKAEIGQFETTLSTLVRSMGTDSQQSASASTEVVGALKTDITALNASIELMKSTLGESMTQLSAQVDAVAAELKATAEGSVASALAQTQAATGVSPVPAPPTLYAAPPPPPPPFDATAVLPAPVDTPPPPSSLASDTGIQPR